MLRSESKTSTTSRTPEITARRGVSRICKGNNKFFKAEGLGFEEGRIMVGRKGPCEVTAAAGRIAFRRAIMSRGLFGVLAIPSRTLQHNIRQNTVLKRSCPLCNQTRKNL